MSEPEQCIICLDPLPRAALETDAQAAVSVADAVADAAVTDGAVAGGEPAPEPAPIAAATALYATAPSSLDDDSSYLNIVAALDGCNHIIHDACIRSWAQKTNTCPICRNPFHSVRVYNGVDGKFSSPALVHVCLHTLTGVTMQEHPSRNTKSKTRSRSQNST